MSVGNAALLACAVPRRGKGLEGVVLKGLFFVLAEPRKYLVSIMPPELLNQEKRRCDGQEGGAQRYVLHV